MPQLELDEEQAWIRSSQQGDHTAFEALIARHQRMIYSLTFRMTGSVEEAEDLSQETFIHAFRQLAGYRGEAKFSSWLYRIAINLCLNWKKSSERDQQFLKAWSQEQPDAPHHDSRTQQVQEALLKLKPKQRAAVILTTYDGLSHGEAARLLGCSETTVSWRIYSAKAKLKKLLKTVSRQVEGV
jgi:RNA polymerase sigma-70 factor (ECF subfamily)